MLVVEHVVRTLAPKFQSRLRDQEDTGQIIRFICIQARSKYRPESGDLGGFLYVVSKNRLHNASRAEFGRVTDPTCRVCYDAERGLGPRHPDGQFCAKHISWLVSNERRQALADPHAVLDDCHVSREPGAEDLFAAKDLDEFISERLPAELRVDYAKLRDGISKLGNGRRKVVRRAVAEILARASCLPDGLREHLGVPADGDEQEKLSC